MLHPFTNYLNVFTYPGRNTFFFLFVKIFLRYSMSEMHMSTTFVPRDFECFSSPSSPNVVYVHILKTVAMRVTLCDDMTNIFMVMKVFFFL